MNVLALLLVALAVATCAATTAAAAAPIFAAASTAHQRTLRSTSGEAPAVHAMSGLQGSGPTNVETTHSTLQNRRSRRVLFNYRSLDQKTMHSITKKKDYIVNVNDASGAKNIRKPTQRRSYILSDDGIMIISRKRSNLLTPRRKIFKIKNHPSEHAVSKRSPLEVGLIHGISTNHHVTHHGTNSHTSSHHNVVLHPPKAPHHHVVEISSLHDVDGLVTHAVIDHGLHITSTTVITHDKPLTVVPAHHVVTAHAIVAADHPVIEQHEVEVIPVVVKHEVVPIDHPIVAKAAIVLPHTVDATHDVFRSHIGGFGVGLDFGGHGAGHGFYASTGFGLR